MLVKYWSFILQNKKSNIFKGMKYTSNRNDELLKDKQNHFEL